MTAGRQTVESFLRRLNEQWPIERWREEMVLVAVSGGADSVALAHSLHRLALPAEAKLAIAHFNHQLRPDAEQDERWVEQLAASLGRPCHVGRGDVRRQSALAGDGIEAAARNERYRFLVQTAEAIGARYVAVAHTADDQAETILHRVLRGAGIAGLAGMPRVRPLSPACSLVRPLLAFRRREVHEFLAALGASHREDPSNLDLALTRNRLRHELLPQLMRQYNPQVVEALLKLGRLAGEHQALLDDQVESLRARVVLDARPAAVTLDTSALVGQPGLLVRELCLSLWRSQAWPMQAMGYEQWERLAGFLLDEAPAAMSLPGEVEIVRDRAPRRVIFRRKT